MKKATLNLNETTYKHYNINELEINWREYPAVTLWLKARRFDFSLPVFTSPDYQNNSIIFYQMNQNSNKNVLVVHPHDMTLKQLKSSLINAGHTVTSFKRVKEANIEIAMIKENNYPIDFVIIPAHLKVTNFHTYKQFLNHKYPNLKVLTIDKRDFRDTINLKKELSNEI